MELLLSYMQVQTMDMRPDNGFFVVVLYVQYAKYHRRGQESTDFAFIV